MDLIRIIILKINIYKQDIEKEYGIVVNDYFLFINFSFVVISDLVQDIIYLLNFPMFNYWMFEMLFYELFHSRLFKTKIYKHHILSLIFILSSCSIFETIVIILKFTNETEDAKFFENRKWLIPIGFISFLLFHIFKTYTNCNEKYYLEKRLIPITKYLLFYGMVGLLLSSICAVLSSCYPCGDETIPEISKDFCGYKDDNGNYYFSNYNLYFKDLTSENFVKNLIFTIITCILNYFGSYYIYAVYKELSPVYYICTNRFVNPILSIYYFINDYIKNDNIQNIDIFINIFNFLILIFYILGSIVYLEFIELNFCNLNFYTRKNIRKRAILDREIFVSEYTINTEGSINENDY